MSVSALPTVSNLPDTGMIADQLCALWEAHQSSGEPYDQFATQEAALIEAYRGIWTDALALPGCDLPESVVRELMSLEKTGNEEQVKELCREAVQRMKNTWLEEVDPGRPETITAFYDQNRVYIFELMWWHTLTEDPSPLGYVSALHLACRHGKTRFMDFGAGVGSGALLFARHGFEVTLADISETLLDFSARRLGQRGVPAHFVDLKKAALPHESYDFVAAMDVFEHIADSAPTVKMLGECLLPGGILFGRFHSEEDEDRPQHIAMDFQETFRQLEECGFREIWRDRWLWGHQAFQKSC